MSTQKMVNEIYEDEIGVCKECGQPYVIRESTAWSITEYCDGECEILAESGEDLEDE